MVEGSAPAVILDNGSGFIKCGFAGTSHPACVMPTVVGRPPKEAHRSADLTLPARLSGSYSSPFPTPSVTASSSDGSAASSLRTPCRHDACLVGDEALRRRAGEAPPELHYPIVNGIVTNWDEMHSLWDRVFFDKLGLHINGEQPDTDDADPAVVATADAGTSCRPRYPHKNHSVNGGAGLTERALLMAETPILSQASRERLFETMFETYRFARVQSSPQAALTVFAAGLVSGVAVECGDSRTHCSPVFDGYPLVSATRSVEIGGRTITELLSRLLQQRRAVHRGGPRGGGGGIADHFGISAIDRDVVRRIKEQRCYTAVDITLEERLARETTATEAAFRLPDGTMCTVGNERYEAPEVLFRPSLIDVDSPGLSDQLWGSIQAADMDLRMTLYNNIVLSGGSSMFPGLPTRLQRDLTETFLERNLKGERSRLRTTRCSIRVLDAPRRRYMVFLGGAALAQQTAATPDMWMTKGEWEEGGVTALRARFGVAGV